MFYLLEEASMSRFYPRPLHLGVLLVLLVFPVMAMAETDELIATGGAWKYNDTGSDLHSAWPFVSDDPWARGACTFGIR